MRNVSDKVVKEIKTPTMFNNFFLEIHNFSELKEKNVQ